ncbi:Thiamine pyrophosphokinase 1 [Bienertia sinuspersici]
MEVMHHSTHFLLPSIPSSEHDFSPKYSLVILNQRLPRFMPLLWEHEQQKCEFVQMEEQIVYLMKCHHIFLSKIHLMFAIDMSLAMLFRASCQAHMAIGWIKCFTARPIDDVLCHGQVHMPILSYKPDVIKGDMDSVRKDVLDFYAKLVSGFITYQSDDFTENSKFWGDCSYAGIMFVTYPYGCEAINESHDQDTTDLNKCISHLSSLTPESEKSKLCILVTGALGGRFDHEAGNINVLYRFPSLRIILLSDDCLIQLLPRTHHHKIHIQSSVVGPHCGLLPIGVPAFHTTTSGLKWDLNDKEMMFGGLISTSNLVKGDTVSVHSDADLIWTISIKSEANFKFKHH